MGTYIRNKLSKKEMETTAEELRHGQIVIVTARWAASSGRTGVADVAPG